MHLISTRKAWETFEKVVKEFLSKRRAENYSEYKLVFGKIQVRMKYVLKN